MAVPYWVDRHPDHVAASQLVTDGVFNAGLRRYAVEGEAWKPEWVCYYFINDSAPPSFVVDVSETYETKRQSARLPRDAVPAAGGEVRCHSADLARSFPAHREPRRAVRRPCRRGLRGRGRRQGAGGPPAPVPRPVGRPVNIGIVCYASVGGSGIVATELGKALALARPPGPLHQHRDAVPTWRVPGRAVVSSGAHADLSALPGAAVPVVARQQDRAGRARVRASTSSTRTTPFRTRRRRSCRSRCWPRPGTVESRAW